MCCPGRRNRWKRRTLRQSDPHLLTQAAVDSSFEQRERYTHTKGTGFHNSCGRERFTVNLCFSGALFVQQARPVFFPCIVALAAGTMSQQSIGKKRRSGQAHGLKANTQKKQNSKRCACRERSNRGERYCRWVTRSLCNRKAERLCLRVDYTLDSFSTAAGALQRYDGKIPKLDCACAFGFRYLAVVAPAHASRHAKAVHYSYHRRHTTTTTPRERRGCKANEITVSIAE